MFKKIILFLLIFSTSCVANDPLLKNRSDIDEIKKVNMFNLREKMNYLIHKLQIGKKYDFEKQKEFIEYIILGTWENPPSGFYFFDKNHQYKMLGEENKIVIGRWRFSSDGLDLYSNGKTIKAKIKHFVLYKDAEEERYYFNISFEKVKLLLSIDSAYSKIWEKEPPII